MEVEPSAPSAPPSAATAAASAARLVFPGDLLPVSGSGIRLGNGTVQASAVANVIAQQALQAQSQSQATATPAVGQVLVTKCGYMKKGPHGKIWIDNAQKRYIPSLEDPVLGVVVESHAESYRVDIGGSATAILPTLAFEGATKRNYPHLAVGALVYARVVVAHKDIDVELACTSPLFKKEWVTGQSLFGEITGGATFNCDTRLARSLLQEEEAYVLSVIGKYVPFEIAIGVNGRVWVNSGAAAHTILIINAILNSQGRSKEQITAMARQLMSVV